MVFPGDKERHRVDSCLAGQAINLWDAWSIWLQDKSVADCQFWGQTFRTWGRIGKLMQYFAAMTILIELVGIEKIQHQVRKIAHVLRNNKLVFFIMTILIVLSIRELFKIFSKSVENWTGLEMDASIGGLMTNEGVHWAASVIMIAVVIWLVLAKQFGSPDRNPIDLAAQFLQVALASPFQYIARHRRLWLMIQGCAFVILTLGFWMDLLAS